MGCGDSELVWEMGVESDILGRMWPEDEEKVDAEVELVVVEGISDSIKCLYMIQNDNEKLLPRDQDI